MSSGDNDEIARQTAAALPVLRHRHSAVGSAGAARSFTPRVRLLADVTFSIIVLLGVRGSAKYRYANKKNQTSICDLV